MASFLGIPTGVGVMMYVPDRFIGRGQFRIFYIVVAHRLPPFQMKHLRHVSSESRRCNASATVRFAWRAFALTPQAGVSDAGNVSFERCVENIRHSGEDLAIHRQGGCESRKFS